MIYLDHNATTPCAPEVIDAMLPYFGIKYGNAGSVTHAFGWTAAEAVKNARQNMANYLHCDAEELYFTSGATEACNMAIQGVFNLYQVKGKVIFCAANEHKAVLDTYAFLEKYHGAIVKIIPVLENGNIDYQYLENHISDDTVLVSVMYANNETGNVNDVYRIGAITRNHKVLFFCDATQALGKLPIDLQNMPIDLLAVSAHKIYGPKGVGVLYARRKQPRVQLLPILFGGGQERNRRSGTLNVPGIVGFSSAITLAQDTNWLQEVAIKRNFMEQEIQSIHPSFQINGLVNNRLPHVTNIALLGIKAEQLVAKINHSICISLGSACAAAQQGPSHVLEAMHLSPLAINGSVRISLGRYTTDEEISEAIKILKENIIKLL